MTENRTFTVRPLSKQPRSDLRDSFRISLSSSSLASLKLRAGDLCSLKLGEGLPKTAIAWTAVENIQNTVLQTSKTLQECYGIKLGDKVSISKVDQQLREVDVARLQECTDPEKLEVFGDISDTDIGHWEWCLEHPLLRCEILAVNLTFEVEVKGQRRSFRVVELLGANSSDAAHTIYRFTGQSKVKIGDGGGTTYRDRTLKVQSFGLGGLSRQIEQINESLSDFNSGLQKLAMPAFYEHSRGMLIYGPKGTGKTSLLRQIEAAGWKRSFTIGTSTISRNVGEGETKLRRTFQEALRCQPSVVLIDQVEFIAPKRSSQDSSSLSSVLCETLDGIKGASVLVVAATRHPNDVDDALRTPHRLAIEVELPVPTAADRAEILRAIRGQSTELSERLTDTIAEKTHGYVGADLFALLQLACRKARNRHVLQDEPAAGFDTESPASAPREPDAGLVPVEISEEDVLSALQDIRPTAMKEVFLETPKVRWSDIGGQHDIKQRLQKAVQRPLQFPERMKRLNVNSKKGILLYGPPGCSKTLTVKALATEAGLNFLAVKGAEILSMYVGESERALREIFRKARSARPSIIFFDEIDAIAYKRGTSSQGGVNVLTTLLNEMDGIEELRNVLVVAATNKPDILDPALMRPGRLDNLLYIGPPDLEARQEILNIWFKKSAVHPEVNIADLAVRTEGHSGAEIVSICETAGDAALDEEEETGQEGYIMWKHFEYALGQVRRQITQEVVREYEQWGRSHDA